MDPLAQHLDFANHHANATPADIQTLCAAVLEHGFHAAFVNAAYITLAKKLLNGKAPVGTVVSFPLGQDTVAAKMAATNEAVQLGTDELDVVPNIGALLAGDTAGFLHEMTEIVDSARMVGRPVIVKFILDPGYFDGLPNKKEKMQEAARAVKESGADYVKIGSGLGPRNPTLEDLAIIKEAVPTMKLKVAGGITTREVAEGFLAAGALHLGTSHAIEIISGATKNPLAETHASP
jgi:deoxyribose-phosphate aldolase